MIRVHNDFFVPKYQTGTWFWDEEEDEVHFNSHYEKMMASKIYLKTGGFKFLKTLNQAEEFIFRQEFQRDDTTFDADVILTADIVNLVMFLAPSEIITSRFVHFINTKTVQTFLRCLIIYFEYFLRMVEFLLIRRDEISGNMPRMQSRESVKIKRIYSAHLTQYRLLIAREYSKILLGFDDMASYHHYSSDLNISKTRLDRFLHESLLAFCCQVVWIAMHRRAYDVITMEMGRLFRSEHFLLQSTDPIKFNETERKILYGNNYRRVNYRAQNSPLIQEIQNVSKLDLPILWIGEQKYRGTDLRIHELEMEFLVPSSQLILIDKVHGILGHPKKLYNTALQLNWSAVRKQNYCDDYDPYNLVKQPRLQIPQLNEEIMRKSAKHFDAYYHILHYYERWDKAKIQKWLNRDETIQYFRDKGELTTAWHRCLKVLSEETTNTNVDEITQQFIARFNKLHKKREDK